MAKFKEGDLLTCSVCGIVVVVDEACGCAMGEIICCMDKPMVKGKAAAAKAKKLAAAAKAVKGKTVATARAAKPAAKAKPAVKKTIAKKAAAKAKK
jgi:hypothetical protein